MGKYKNDKRIQNRTKRVIFVIFCLGIFCGCGHKNPYIPKDIKPVTVEVVRFDSAQLAVRPDSALEDIKQLYSVYDEFMPVFVEGILDLPIEDTLYLSKMYADFLMDTTMGFAQTNAFVQEHFADIDEIQQKLNNAFGRLHYLYPEWGIPRVYLFVSGFNSSIMYYENLMGVGLDMYLGSNYPYYNQVVYEYQKQTMRKECVVVELLSIYLAYNVSYNSKYNRLLDQMIFRGKQLFLLSQLLPEESLWEIIGYSKEQWNWCEQYERAIWNRIMEKRDLFKTESIVLGSYMKEGPFTAEVTQDSPGRLGWWVGFRIVDSYMRNNKKVTLHELMNENDAQKILEQSYYKP
jgi:hypothetical protein